MSKILLLIGKSSCKSSEDLVADLCEKKIPFVYLSQKHLEKDEISHALYNETGIKRDKFPFSMLINPEFPKSLQFDAIPMGPSRSVIQNVEQYIRNNNEKKLAVPNWTVLDPPISSNETINAFTNNQHFMFTAGSPEDISDDDEGSDYDDDDDEGSDYDDGNDGGNDGGSNDGGSNDGGSNDGGGNDGGGGSNDGQLDIISFSPPLSPLSKGPPIPPDDSSPPGDLSEVSPDLDFFTRSKTS